MSVDELSRADEHFEVAPEPGAPRAARRRVAELLAGVPDLDLDVVALLVSELVTNVVLHAGSVAHLRVRVVGDHVRVEVADRSPQLPVLRPVRRGAVTGRGLHIVDRLADRWGVRAGDVGDGKVVWFELDRSGDRQGVR